MGLTKVTYAMINGASFNVYDFGAVGDGVADDTAAFQAALDAIKASDTTCSLWVPAGTYLISDTLTYDQTNKIKSVSIIGEDETKTIIHFTGTGGCFYFNVGGVTASSQANRVVVKSLSLYTTSTNAGAAIRIIGDSWVAPAPTTLIEDVFTYQDTNNGKYWTYGIHLTDCQDVWISRCYSMHYGDQTTACLFIDNDTANPFYGVYINESSFNGGDSCVKSRGWVESFYITDSSLVGATTCADLDATTATYGNIHLTIKGSHFNGKYRAINVTNWRTVMITGANIGCGVGGGDVSGENLNVVDCEYVTITGNVFECGVVADLDRNFISFNNTTEFSVTGNIMTNASIAGITIGGTSSRGIITDNVIAGFVDGTQNNEGVYVDVAAINVNVSDNFISYFNKGVYSAASYSVINGNTFSNISSYAVEVGAGTGSVCFNNTFRNCANTVTGLTTAVKRELYRPGAITGATIASGAILTRSFSTAGCQVGDFVDVGAPLDLQGMSATANVSVNDTCVLTITNLTGTSKTIADATWNFRFHN